GSIAAKPLKAWGRSPTGVSSGTVHPQSLRSRPDTDSRRLLSRVQNRPETPKPRCVVGAPCLQLLARLARAPRTDASLPARAVLDSESCTQVLSAGGPDPEVYFLASSNGSDCSKHQARRLSY